MAFRFKQGGASNITWHVATPLRFLKTARRNFFLKKRVLSPETLNLLRAIYPAVDWKRVDVYEGLPWFTPLVAPYVNAQALPHFYSTGRFCIYLRVFDETRAQCLADLVHEAFHVMQAMQFARGYGVGCLRGWLVHYIAQFLSDGYRHNLFEIPAYDQEYRFLNACVKHRIAGVVPRVQHERLTAVSEEPGLVFSTFEYRYRKNPVFLPLAFIICLAACLVKPVADLLVFFTTFPARKK